MRSRSPSTPGMGPENGDAAVSIDMIQVQTRKDRVVSGLSKGV